MTPPNWNHVDHDVTRRVLAGELVDGESVAEALSFSHDSLNADVENEDVTDKMFTARSNAYTAAEFGFDADDLKHCVEALRRFWSV